MASPNTRPRGRLGAAFPPTAKPFTFPASVAGVNALDSLMMMAPEDCVYTYNLMPVEYGLRLRQGYRQWATNCAEVPASGASTDIRTLIGYESQLQDPANDRLFAVTAEGIWNVTNFNTTDPVQEVQFVQQNDPAGYGVYVEFTNDSERHFMFYADALNGIHAYEEGVGWSIPAGWTYDDPNNPGTQIPFPVGNVAFVMVHKLRIWVVLEDSDDAWYLPLYSIAGELKKFTFGSKLVHGGNLMGLWNWTIDGGDGVDDYLIAVSRGGDIALYRGADPEASDWGTTGSWFIGEVPESRRIVAEYGSEMYLLSTFGITSLRDLLEGTPANELRRSPSAKVNRFLRADVESGKDFNEWSINIHPADGFMQIVTPEPFNTDYVQYNQNLTTKAWGFWEGVPMICGQTWNGDYFLGGKEGQVYIYDGVLDGTTIDGVDFWNNTASGVNPPEWVQAPAGTFTCDGTQGGDTSYNVVSLLPVLGTLYTIEYTVSGWAGGQHRIEYGGNQTDWRSGNGTFVQNITALNAASALATLQGDVNFQGAISDVRLVEAGILGEAVNFRTLTSFQGIESHSNFKLSGFVRTIGVLAGTAILNVKAVYDYRIETEVLPPAVVPSQGDNIWDSALWDQSLWDFSVEGQSFPVGALGIGRAVAVAVRGNSNTRINIVGWDYIYQLGGFL